VPITPFHFGPGLLAKAATPRYFSLSAYCATQVVIDCESAYFLLTGGWPIHRGLHTLVGGAAVGALSAILVFAIGSRSRSLAPLRRRPLFAAEFTVGPCLAGGVVGGLLHAVLDGIMHSDTQPLQPFSIQNPFYRELSLGSLHILLVVAGLAALPIILRPKLWRAAG